MSSELFESREDDLRHICENVRRKLTDQLPRCAGESQKQLCRELERSLEEALILIHDMEAELRKAPASYRMSMLSRVRNYKHDVEQLTADVRRSVAARTGVTQPQFGFSEEDEFQRTENAQRSRLLQGTASLNRGSDSIARSHQVAAETDQVADEIVSELGTQRESLLRTQDRLHDTDTNLSRSRKIVNTMMTRVFTNKIILVVIILLELAILGIVVWWKFFKK